MNRLCLFLLSIITLSGYSQHISEKKLNSYFEILDTNDRSSGSIALRADGKLIYQNAFGLKNLEDSQKIKPDSKTAYRIGSISKMFTSVLVFQMVEQGKLSLNDPLSKFYPSVPFASEITIDQMLQHSSGIHSFTDDPDYPEYMEVEQSHKQMMARIYASKPDFKPGEKNSYSNANYLILGYILEKVSGLSYAELLEKNIVKPLRLKRTYYGGTIDAQKRNEAASFSWTGASWDFEKETHMSIPHGAGAVVSTPEDLTRFVTALFKGKLISKESLAIMTSTTEGYGRGIFEEEINGKKVFGHSGGIDAFVSFLKYSVEDEVAVAFTANVGRINNENMVKNLFNEYWGVPWDLPVYKNIVVDSEVLKGLEGVYSSEAFPMDIAVRATDKVLYARATGQPELALEPTDDFVFEFERAGIVMTFTRNEEGENCCFRLNQGDFEAEFIKKELVEKGP